MTQEDSKQTIYLAADLLLLLASNSSARDPVIDSLIIRSRSSSYVTGVVSLTAVVRRFRRAGSAPEAFLRFLSPLLQTVLPVEERDLLDALRLANDQELELDQALEASQALRYSLPLFSRLETFDRVPGLHRLAT